jgi:hypothetical protein
VCPERHLYNKRLTRKLPTKSVDKFVGNTLDRVLKCPWHKVFLYLGYILTLLKNTQSIMYLQHSIALSRGKSGGKPRGY